MHPDMCLAGSRTADVPPSGADYLYLKDAGVGVLAYDAVTCGRSEMDPSKRSDVRSKDWLPDDVEAFYQVLLA